MSTPPTSSTPPLSLPSAPSTDPSDLAARLAALRPPSSTFPAPTTDDLAARFTALFNRAPASHSRPELPTRPQRPTDVDAVLKQHEEGFAGRWGASGGADDGKKTAEELLRGMQETSKSIVASEKEAANFNPKTKPWQEALDEDVEKLWDEYREVVGGKSAKPEWLEDTAGSDDDEKQSEREAEEIVRELRDEAALEQSRALENINGKAESSRYETAEEDEDPEIAALKARFAALTSASPIETPTPPEDELQLPGVPKVEPGKKPVVTARVKGKKEEDDEDAVCETDTWCCICNEDAEFKCSGCENDLYCENCLWEAHTGLEEKRHKWTRYERPKKVKAYGLTG